MDMHKKANISRKPLEAPMYKGVEQREMLL